MEIPPQPLLRYRVFVLQHSPTFTTACGRG